MAPSGIRGRLVSWNQFAIIFGMLVVYFVNYAITFGQSDMMDRRYGLEIHVRIQNPVPALVFFLLLFMVPETPRHLTLNDEEDKALTVLNRIYRSPSHAKKILANIKSTKDGQSEQKTPLFTFGKKVIIIGIMISFFQQFIGINVALYYAPRIFADLGAGANASMVHTVGGWDL